MDFGSRIFAAVDKEHEKHHDEEEECHTHAYSVHCKIANEVVTFQE